jgi:hypothetical protein
MDKMERAITICEEAKNARHDLEAIQWRVNYLVGNDGKTPCTTRRFLLKGNSVVLNLYHPEVTELLLLSDKAPSLAGHWGLAMCLTDPGQKILAHLSHEAREDLILADAIAKCGTEIPTDDGKEDETQLPSALRDFLRNVLDDFDN